jgi:demethylmenaquinone methyltransferase/2-methoxy-6-polyprenyl-1,4-benzoquinol methylase
MAMIKSDKVKNIYENKRVSKYNRSISHLNIAKKKTINRSNLKSGDKVIVFCCGTGLDFPHIQEKIGPTGKITGLDFSKNMLEEAKKLIDKKEWKNIELV